MPFGRTPSFSPSSPRPRRKHDAGDEQVLITNRRAAIAASLLTTLLVLAGGCHDTSSPNGILLIKTGDVVSGTVTSEKAIFYGMKVKAGEQGVLYLQATAAAVSLTLLDGSGNIINATIGANDSPNATQSRWIATPTTSSDASYAVKISAYGSQTANYRVELSAVNRGPESGSAAIQLGTIVQEAIDQPADVDEYTFNATAGQQVEIYLQQLAAASAQGVLASIQSDSGQAFAGPAAVSSPPDGDLEQFASGALTIPTTGRYRVVVRGQSSYVGAYRFEILPIDRAPEHAAAALVSGDTVSNESIDHVGDVDEFTLSGTAGSEYNVFVEASGAAPHAVTADVVSLPDFSATATPGGLPLLQNATGRFRMPASGSVTIRVHDASDRNGLYRGPYRLFAKQILRTPEGVPPTAVVGGPAVNSAIEVPGDIDEYLFSVSTPTMANVVFTRASDAVGSTAELRLGKADSASALLPPDLSLLTTTSISSGHITFQPGITYRVTIDGLSTRGDGFRGGYSFELRAVNPAPESVGARIAIGDTTRGESLENAGDIDTYTFSATTTDTFHIRLMTPGQSNPGITFYLFDPTTNQMIATSVIDQTYAPHPYIESGRLVLDPGDYKLVVQSYDDGSTPNIMGAYELALERVSARPEHRSAQLALGDTVRNEPIDYIGDYDDFFVHGQPGQEIFARFAWITDPNIYSSGGGSLAILDSTTGAILQGAPSYCCVGDTRRVAFPQSGVLRIRVQALGQHTGAYWFVASAINRAPETRSATFALGDTVADAIRPSADIDEYTFQGTAGQSVDVYFQSTSGITSGYGSLQLDLIDLTTGNVLSTLTAYGGTLNLTDISQRGIVLPSTGSYRVRVQSSDNSQAEGDYRFLITPSP
jgi:hypothetical protein